MGIRRLDSSEVGRAIESLLPHFNQEFVYYKQPDARHLIPVWTRMMVAGVGVALQATKDGGPVGIFLGLIAPEMFTGELQAIESLWYVRREYRPEFSVALLREFEMLAKCAGCTSILSGAGRFNRADVMARFYKRRGYEFHGSAFRKAL